VWNWQTPGHAVLRYLRAVGFHFDYRAEGVRVWRPNVSR
jgi:hypothetical protein